MALLTFNDVATYANRDMLFGLVDQAIKLVPEVNTISWRTVPGTYYDCHIRTVYPTVAFRQPNTGSSNVHSSYAKKTIECALLSPQWIVDKAVADASIRGAAELIAAEAQALLQGTMVTLGKQMWYGHDSDSLGFPGLDYQVDASMVLDAKDKVYNGGTSAGTPTTDKCSTVYLVAAGNPDHLAWVLGSGGQLSLTDVKTQYVPDDSGKLFNAYTQGAEIWAGLQLGHAYSVGKIINVSPATPLTDAMIYDCIELFPGSVRPYLTGIYMTRRSQGMLRKSRTTYNPVGAPAPLPANVEGPAGGLPIHVSESILDTLAADYTSNS